MKRALWHLAAFSLVAFLSNCVPDRGWRAPTSAAPGPAPAYTVSLLGTGPLVIPSNSEVDGLTVGGLSDLVRVEGDAWRAIVDNQEDTPARVFELRFGVTESGAAPLEGDTLYDVPRSALRLAGLNGKTFDGEGLALTPRGTLLVSSETEPSIREVSAAGETLRSLPVPDLFLADKLAGRGVRINAGFEALDLYGQTLWTGNETALAQDAPDEARFATHPIRLLRYDSEVPTAQYVYVLDPIERRGSGFSVRGLVDLVILPEGGLLALEREFVEGVGMEVQLFHVSIDGATEVSGMESLAGQTYTPVRKTLLHTFESPDNLEGIAFGPDLPDGDRTLVLVSDDNFQPIQQTQIVALRLHSATRGGS
ncbi:MAG TPA: esterase-like activity of phytase family protein [Thermoanaerobaculia bacterium]|nr:esterase-like activity of phytase family protein [Thermoanaerobaculia bacterium]